MDQKWATWWKKEIRSRSKNIIDSALYLGILSLFVLLLLCTFGLYIKTYLPHGGQVWIFEIASEDAKLISFVSEIIGLISGAIGITIIAAWKLHMPKFTRYPDAARSIVEELASKKLINAKIKQDMLNVIAKELTPCIDRRKKKQCEEGLLRSCYELSELL